MKQPGILEVISSKHPRDMSYGELALFFVIIQTFLLVVIIALLIWLKF